MKKITEKMTETDFEQIVDNGNLKETRNKLNRESERTGSIIAKEDVKIETYYRHCVDELH